MFFTLNNTHVRRCEVLSEPLFQTGNPLNRDLQISVGEFSILSTLQQGFVCTRLIEWVAGHQQNVRASLGGTQNVFSQQLALTDGVHVHRISDDDAIIAEVLT